MPLYGSKSPCDHWIEAANRWLEVSDAGSRLESRRGYGVRCRKTAGPSRTTWKLLDGKANVHRVPTNCGPTTRDVEQIDQWLVDKPWDVIHFNWGLHDLKYMGDLRDRRDLVAVS